MTDKNDKVSSQQIKPVQMIKFDEKKNIQLTQQAIQIFNKLQCKQLCIVCVAGKYRTGKSYILNRVLLGKNSGFEVGPTINACTKGLWMWPQIVKINFGGSEKQCVIIDTEGLGSLQEGQNTDIKIFLMATLLSSYLIFNSVGSIDQKALESLNLVINMAKLLEKTGDKFDSQQLINSFPSFMWLVRDFSLRLENQHGQAINSQQYLQNALKFQNGKSIAVERKNQIRKQLKTFFQQRDCFTLIRPTLNQRDLQNLSSLPEKKLRPQFVELINELKTRISVGIESKKIRGKSITPQGFIELCNYYVNNVNLGKLPSISSHWDNICINQSGRLIKKYQIKLKQYISQKPVRNNQKQDLGLQQYYGKLINEASQTIDKSFLGKLQKKLLKQKLQKTLNDELSCIFQEKFQNEQKDLCNQLNSIFTQYDQSIFLLNEEDDNSQTKVIDSFYSRIESLKSLFSKFQTFITQALKLICKNKILVTSENNVMVIQKLYNLFFQQIKQKMFNMMQEEYFNLDQTNTELFKKISNQQVQWRARIDFDKAQQSSLKNQIQSLKRKQNLNKFQLLSFSKKNLQLQTSNSELKSKVSELKQKFIQEKQNSNQKFKNLEDKIKIQLKSKIRFLEEQLKCLNAQKSNNQSQIKQLQIKERKIQRQCEIYKQKSMEQAKQNQDLIKQIQELKIEILKVQKERRNLLRKGSYKTLNSTFNSSLSMPSGTSLKEFIKLSDHKEPKIQIQCYDQLDQQNNQLELLLEKINLFEIENKNLQLQNKNIFKLLNEQRSLNQILIQAPQTVNYQSLKKNYQLQKRNTQILGKKVKDFEEILVYTSRFQCNICGDLINKNSVLSKHYPKCLGNLKKNINFDVSYVYNAQGQLNFLFQVEVQDNNSEQNIDALERLGLEKSEKSEKWQVTKSLQSIKLFLEKINIQAMNISLFEQNQKLSNGKENQNFSEERINLNQQRRVYLQQLCQNLKCQIWKKNECIQFFGIDLHLFKKNKVKKETVFPKKKKIGMLNLDLGQIIQEPNNENDGSLNNWNKKKFAESVNLMKTTKFSMKKVFKFGPHV